VSHGADIILCAQEHRDQDRRDSSRVNGTSGGGELPPVFLLGGRLNTLSAVRSLGARGVEVHVLDHRGEGSVVARSRHCAHYLDTPPGADTTEWWMQTLVAQAPGAVVFPGNDPGLELLALRSGELVRAGCLPVRAAGEAVLASLDKEATYERARAVGVPAPRTVRVLTEGDIGHAAADLTFPFALKPVSSHRFWDDIRPHHDLFSAWLSHPKGVVVRDREQLDAAAGPLASLGVEILATEVVVGPDAGFSSYYTYLTEDDAPLFHFTKQKTRQYPIHFGAGTFHTTAWDPETAELGLRLVRGLGLRGIANVEFKRDVRHGTLCLIECNPRLTATDALERRVGLDLPWIAYQDAIGRRPSPPGPFAYGRRQWLPRQDLRAFLAYRRAGELNTTQWLRSLAGPLSFAALDPTDMGPIAAMARRSVGSWMRRHGPSRARELADA
jgi:D-aspartate ligase